MMKWKMFKTPNRFAKGAITMVGIAGMITSLSSPARAECLGLGLPPPADLNICRQLVEDLLIPPVVRFEPYCKVSGFGCFTRPHCCVPGACLLSPSCVAMQQIEEVAGYVVHAGDLYCGVQELAPEQVLSDLIADRFPDPGPLSEGGFLVDVAAAYVDGLECRASALSPALFAALNVIMATPGFPDAFTNLDLERARIIPRRDSGVLHLPPSGESGITLGSLIFLTDELFDTLYSWEGDIACMSYDEQYALSTLAHEVTHVRQYRELGREKFIDQYLVQSLKGTQGNAFEVEAEALEDWLVSEWPYRSQSACDPRVPTMTGPNAPSGSVERSGAYSSAYEAWMAFDANPNSQWISKVGETPAQIGYRWPSHCRKVGRYALDFVNGSLTSRAPKTWTFEGDNGGGWTVLDARQSETNWRGVERREYAVANPGCYSAYRFSFTDDNAPAPGIVVVSLGGIEFLP
jgi:hypothetical protein